MPSIITASTASNTALNFSADTSGVLEIRTGSSPTTALTISTAQVATFVNDASISGLTVGKGGGAISSNTAFGVTALASNTTGIENTANGLGSLASNTTGNRNAAFGYYSGILNTTGSNNTAVGNNALFSNTTASNNTAVGYQAGYSNTTGADSVFVGRGAGFSATTGSQHVCVGFNAGYSATTGWGNTLIGQAVGYSLTTGSGNTFVGGADGRSVFPSGYFVTTGSNNTILGAYSGNQDSYDMRTLSSRVVISDGAGNRQLTMYEGGTVALDNAVPQSGTGITFPATQSPSSNANTLDDYEEGNWTPTDNSGAGLTFTGVGGTYTKVGRLVTCQFNVNYPVTSNNAQAGIAGLPYAVATISGISNPLSGFITYTTSNIVLTIPGAGGGTSFNFWNIAGGTIINSQLSNADVRMTIIYLTT